VIVRRFKGSRVQGFKGSRVQGFKGSRVQGFKGSRVQGKCFKTEKVCQVLSAPGLKVKNPAPEAQALNCPVVDPGIPRGKGLPKDIECGVTKMI
jgi:hypothetical protein